MYIPLQLYNLENAAGTLFGTAVPLASCSLTANKTFKRTVLAERYIGPSINNPSV